MNALISRMNHLIGCVWEGDSWMTSSGDHIDVTSQALNRILFTFHYLPFVNHPKPCSTWNERFESLPRWPQLNAYLTSRSVDPRSAQISERARRSWEGVRQDH